MIRIKRIESGSRNGLTDHVVLLMEDGWRPAPGGYSEIPNENFTEIKYRQVMEMESEEIAK